MPAHHCLKSDELAIIEKSHTKDITPYYIIVQKGEQVVMLLYAQMLQVKPYHVQSAINNKLLEISAKTLVKTLPLRLLVIGNLFRHDGKHCHVLTEYVNEEELGGIYDNIIQILQKESCCLATLVKDTTHFQISYFEKKGYVQYENDISMQMAIPATWTSLNDYEKALKHKYSQRMRKIIKSFQEVQTEELSIDKIIHYKSDIERLYLQVATKQNITLGLLNGDYFVELKNTLQERYKVFGMFYEGKIIAFTSAIVNGAYDMNYIGFDYQYNHSLNLYFNLLFHCIDEAIKHKKSTLILGRTALEAKAVLGCTPIYLKSMYKINNSFIAYFVQKFASSSVNEQGDMWKSRHPFKNA